MNYKAVIAFFFIISLFHFSYSQTTLFVKYKNSIDRASIAQKIASKNFFTESSTVLKKTNYSAGCFAYNLGKNDDNLSRIVKLTFTDNTSLQTFSDQIKSDPSIEYVQAANVYKIDYIPNDSLVSQQWALPIIKAFDAWNITQGADSIIIGLIDTGIDYLHPDLINKIYMNPGESGSRKNNGIDDDGNGFIDDYMGWSFVDRQGYPFDSSSGDYLGWNNNPMDENGHGTYIAGILGAETNNLIGIAGTAPNLKILNVRAFDPSGNGQEDNVASAILYAVMMGAKVINMSFGDDQFSYVLRDVIRYAYSKGVVLVASSGNSGSDEPHYPSGYSEVICVGNSTEYDDVAPSSNYGSTLDLVAPGTDILTTAIGGGYASVSGTSASAPFVSATAGLILSLGNFSNEEVKQIIKSTCDDIGDPGWDIKSGAGRLNIYRALSTIAPAIIKFDYPNQDFSTLSDTLNINATILSPYFLNYSLFIGKGINPVSWTTLIQNSSYQVQKKNIFNLDLTSLPDSTYCLKIAVNLSNGQTTEERVNFNIIRNPPQANLIYASPIFYGSKTTILASMYTNQLCVVRMYYRKTGAATFNYVTLDGFASNIQFLSNQHYGFVPLNIIDQNASYEVYFEAENLTGLKTTIKNGSTNFFFTTGFPIQEIYSSQMPYSLPPGDLFENPVSLTSNDSNEVVIRESSNPAVSNFYKLSGNNFVKFDSLNNQIIKDFGDFNNNGEKDLLTYFVYSGYIFEQDKPLSANLINKFADTTGMFWPILAGDIYNDGKTEILEVNSDTSFVVWKVQNDLSLTDSVKLVDFTNPGSGGNVLDSPHAVIADMNNDGKNEIWMVDKDGDIFSYNILGPKNFQPGRVISTGFTGSTAYLAAGHYSDAKTTDMAVLLHSNPGTDITPYYQLLVFNLKGDSVNIIFDNTFIDPAAEFTSQFQSAENNIRFVDIDKDGKDELILFVFPYAYIFKCINSPGSSTKGINTLISFRDNINSNSIFAGDLNKDGIPEIAFPTNSGIQFFEFAAASSPGTPLNLSGYSIDSTHIKLIWNGNSNKYYLYKGTNPVNNVLFDSCSSNNFVDSKVNVNSNYYYTVAAVDFSKPIHISNQSSMIQVYSHSPARVIKVKVQTQNSTQIIFSDKINTELDNLGAFEVLTNLYPNSIAASTQYSYNISFNNPLQAGLNRLTIHNLSDFYGSPVNNDTLQFSVDSSAAISNFYITSFEILNPYLVRISLNLDLDPTSVMDLNNYSLTPQNRAASVHADDKDPKSLYLNFTGQKPIGSIGIGYTLTIKNLVSSNQTGRIVINSGAGSSIALTSFAKDLSGVYVYPNPVRITGGEGKMTFANLPQKAKITIFTLNGRKINELEENISNGGLDFNIKDENGKLLNSGVYIYRVVRLDNSDAEVEEKIGKFAVIR